MDNTYIIIAIGAVISIISFFLKGTIESLKKLEEKTNEHNVSIEVLKQNHTELEKKFDSIVVMIKELSIEIRQISITLANKKDREK